MEPRSIYSKEITNTFIDFDCGDDLEVEVNCPFCEFKVERDIPQTLSDRLLAAHCNDKHRRELVGLSSSLIADWKLLLQFGDLIEQFDEESRKRQAAIELMADLNKGFRRRLTEALKGGDAKCTEHIPRVVNAVPANT